MRWVRSTTWPAAFFVLAGLAALNWHAQLQTQQKIDALTAALVERAAPTPAPANPPVPAPVPVPKPAESVPRELQRITPPPYMIETPDLLLIEVVLQSKVNDADPLTGKDKGTAATGTAPVRSVAERLPVQPISGQFQVRPDGTVGLGFWGSVPVSGLTLDQTAKSIRAHLLEREPLKQCGIKSESLTVIVDVLAYNSKKYYVIAGAASGEKVFSFPITGSDTVLDALSEEKGLPDFGARRKVWIARRPQQPDQPLQILPVDWAAITQQGATWTNYQLLPGDRVYVTRAAD